MLLNNVMLSNYDSNVLRTLQEIFNLIYMFFAFIKEYLSINNMTSGHTTFLFPFNSPIMYKKINLISILINPDISCIFK